MENSNNNITLITMDELIAEAFERLDIEDSRDELIFRNWIYRALKWIGPSSPDIRTECVSVCDLSFKKPCDYVSGIDMNIMDSVGSLFYFQFAENGWMNSESNRETVNGDLGTNSFLSGSRKIEVGEDDVCFHLNSIAAEHGVSKAEIKYYALPMDENGDPKIKESMVEAIHAYIEFQYTKRSRNRSRGTRKFPLAEVQYLEDRWSRLLIMTKGNIKMPSPLTAEATLRKWVTMIPDFKNKARNSRTSRLRNRY